MCVCVCARVSVCTSTCSGVCGLVFVCVCAPRTLDFEARVAFE